MQLCSALHHHNIPIQILALLILNTTANHSVTNNKLVQQQHKLKTNDCKIYLISGSNTNRKIDNDFMKVKTSKISHYMAHLGNNDVIWLL